MLETAPTIRECRDCHLIVVTPTSGGASYVVARSLGKSCHVCHSFDMQRTRPGSDDWKCAACDAPPVRY